MMSDLNDLLDDGMLCLDKYYILHGKVVEGVGEGAKYVKLYQQVLEKVLEITPYPGTLNVQLSSLDAQKLKSLLQNHKCKFFIPPPCKVCVHAYAWKVYIKAGEGRCFPAYIVKPAKTIHGDDIIELLSEVCLRKELSLKTGDDVEIYITLDCIKPCSCL